MDYAAQLLEPDANPAKAGPTPARQHDYASELLGSSRVAASTRDLPGPTEITATPSPVAAQDAFVAGGIEDPRAKAQFYANRRFPGDPDALNRYGMIEGKLAYRDDDGRWRAEDPGLMSAAGAAERAGEYGLPVAGAAAMMAAAPVGAPAMLLAALGGAGGLGYRKLMGLGAGDQQSAGGNAVDLALEGLLNWAGVKVGQILGKHIVDRRVVRDLPTLNAQDTTRLIDTAAQHGITLTPGEASNLGSLINQQRWMSQGMDDAGDILRKFYGERAGQIAAAVDNFIGTTPAAPRAGAALRDVGRRTLDDAHAARDTAAGPLYRTLDRANPQVDERAFMAIEADDLIAKYMDKVASDPVYGVTDVPRNSYGFINKVGSAMFDDQQALRRAGETYKAKMIGEGRNRLLSMMDEVVPGFKDARRAWAGQTRHIEELEGGFEGLMAKMKDTQLARVPRQLLTSSKYGPGDIKRWRDLFVSHAKEKEWNELVSVYLRDVWESSATKGRTVKELSGARYAEQIFGTPRQRAMLKEAMTPRRYQDLTDFMSVLAATGRAGGQQSMTEPAQQMAARMARQASPAATMLRNLKISDPGGELLDLITDRSVDRWRAQIAKVITSPGAMKELEKLRVLRSLSPSNQKAMQITTNVLLKAGIVSAVGAVVPKPTGPIDQTPSQGQQ